MSFIKNNNHRSELVERVYKKIKKYESKRKYTNDKGKVCFVKEDHHFQARAIILNYKMYEDGLELGIKNYNKLNSELTNIERSITDVERRLKALPRYIKKFNNYPSYEETENLKNKIYSLSEELKIDIENDSPLKTKNTRPIALIEGSMKTWRKLGRRQRPKKLRRESELYKFLRDIFDAFRFNEDVEYWYNKWANIRK